MSAKRKAPAKKRGRPPTCQYPSDGRRVFVRYKNRRLYDTKTHSHVASSVLLRLKAGTFVVVYATTGRDITGWTVASAKHAALTVDLRACARKLGIET